VAKNPPYLDQVRAMIRGTPAAGFIGCGPQPLRITISAPRSPARKPPVLFIAGEKDAGGAVPAAMKALHRDLPGSRYVELPGAGHISNLDRPGRLHACAEGVSRRIAQGTLRWRTRHALSGTAANS
jgi:3-oxoadipate enol-lactonase